jgi:hypothetical protein
MFMELPRLYTHTHSQGEYKKEKEVIIIKVRMLAAFREGENYD